MDQDTTWHGSRPQPRPQCIGWGRSSPQKGTAAPPKFSAHVCCGQTAGWIKMALDREVDLGPGDIVLDGNQAPPKGNSPPPAMFGLCLLWPDSSRSHCVRRGSSSPKKGHNTPTFRPMSVVTKRLDGSRCHLVRRKTSAQATLC